MNRLNDNELYCINGGASITGSLVDAFTQGFKFFYDIGLELGSSIRKLIEDKRCAE